MITCRALEAVLYCTNSMKALKVNTMSTVRKTITLTDAQDDWIKAQVASGDYTNDSEYFRDLIRREQEKVGALKAAIDEGLASGVGSRSLDEIWAEAEARARAANG